MTEHPHITRARKRIKALAEDLKATAEEAPDMPDHVQWFFAGILNGLGAAGRVLNGDSAEQAAEAVEQAMYAAFGKALLDGKITAADIKTVFQAGLVKGAQS